MARAVLASIPDLRQGMLETYAAHEYINQLLLEHLNRRAWRTELPGSKVRTIAAIFAHLHNIRRKWIRLSAPHLKLPATLDPTRCTPQQVKRALAESAELCSQMLAEALDPQGPVQKFHRDGWAKPWFPGAAMFGYMIAHETHHRGQVCMLAHQLGYPLNKQITSRMWGWEAIWKKCRFGPPR